jgi:hypothetical protein
VNHRRNTCGQAYALTVMTAILEGHESALAHYLNTLGTGSASPLASVPGTHFARWVVMGDVVYEGGGQRPDHLRVGRLLFTSNFDGLPEPYLEELRTGLGEVADEIWKHCAGYPGRADAGAFAAYMRSHQIESSLFFAAYGERTVEEVKRSLANRQRVINFALRAQELAAVELQAAFQETFAR